MFIAEDIRYRKGNSSNFFLVLWILILFQGCSSTSEKSPIDSDPLLQVSVKTLSLNNDKTSTAFLIDNKGEQDLHWEILSDLDALSFSELSGVNSRTIKVSVDLSEFEVGSYSEIIFIESNGGRESVNIDIEFSTIDTKIKTLLAEERLPSIASAIVKESELVWEGYYGLSNIESKMAPTKETIYGAASVSKLIVATSVMQLVEKGLLDLDSDINDYLDFDIRNPTFIDDKLTLRMLLTHRSSLTWPDGSIDTEYYQPFPDDTAPDLEKWMKSYLQTEGAWTNHKPGTNEQYSNTAVSLAGLIVQQVTGISYAEYCRQNIFSVLGMTHTDFRHDHLNHGEYAIFYPDKEKYSLPQYPSGGLKTTISDLSKFLIAYLNNGTHEGNRILEQSSLDQIFTIQNAGSGYGLNWYKTGIGYGHSGAIHGVTAQVEIDLTRKIGLLIFVNHTPWLLDDPGIAYPNGRLYQLIAAHAKEISSNN